MKFLNLFSAISLTVLLFAGNGLAQEQKTYLQFDGKITYDIYYSNSEKNSIIRSVEILGFQEIGGKLFLTVQPNGFNLKDYEGFILFDSIQAILPDRNYKVDEQK